MGYLRSVLRPALAPTLLARQAELGATPRQEGGWRLIDPSRFASSGRGPVVSVVTVCFNSAKTIADTIEGIRRQRYAPIEYIVVDGGSKDGTVDLLRQNEDLIAYWRSEPDGGIYDAFNKGIALARGDLVQIINSDDWMEPDQLERGVAALRARPDADFAHGDIWLHGWRGQDVRIGGDPHWDRRVRRTMPAIHQATVLARRRVYETVGLFRTDLRIASDYDWFIRVAKAGLHGVHDPTIVAHMRAGGASTSRQRRTIAEGFACAWNNGDRLLPCAAHWSKRWLWPNGAPSWVDETGKAVRRGRGWFGRARGAVRSRAMDVANAAPILRKLPGRSLGKKALGMRSAEPIVPTAERQASLADFVTVRDLGGGLEETAIERLLLEGRDLAPVGIAASSAKAAQAAEAIRRGGGRTVPVGDRSAAQAARCASVLLDERSVAGDALRGWAGFPILLVLGSGGLRIERR